MYVLIAILTWLMSYHQTRSNAIVIHWPENLGIGERYEEMETSATRGGCGF